MEVMIGIIGAMAEEVAKLKEMMEDVKVTRKASREFYEGKLNGTEVVIVQGGVGKVNAACCTQTLIDTFPVSCVINTGIAGGLFSYSQRVSDQHEICGELQQDGSADEKRRPPFDFQV